MSEEGKSFATKIRTMLGLRGTYRVVTAMGAYNQKDRIVVDAPGDELDGNRGEVVSQKDDSHDGNVVQLDTYPDRQLPFGDNELKPEKKLN